MLVVALISGGVLAIDKMRVDIFPSLNTPKIRRFPGLYRHEPQQMKGFIVGQPEFYFEYIGGVQDIRTRRGPLSMTPRCRSTVRRR